MEENRQAREGKVASGNAEAVARHLKALRLALRIPASQFAVLLGMSLANLHSRERGRAPWRPEEIADAKAKIGKHLVDVGLALDALES